MPTPLPPVVAALTTNITGFKAGMAEAKGELASFSTSSKSSMTTASNVGKLALTGIAIGAGVVGVASVKMAGDFQESVTQLQTGAGESAANLGLVSKGMLDMAGQVGQSAQNLSAGMYLVESAGYHGADGLNVLKAAAQGAKLGNADLKTVADGVTTALTDYQLPAADAAKVTSQLVTAVSLGKTTMGDLSGALSTVLPSASKAGLGLDQVLGAMSTMTAQGVSAQQAAQNLSSTISSLQNPTTVQSKAMAQMGLTSVDIAKNLGRNGLTATMDELSSAIMLHMGPSGLVLQSSFNESRLAADSAKKMLSQLPPSIQKLAQGFLDGTVTQKQWMAELKTQPALTANLGRQFATTAKAANGFSDQLKSGKGDAATFNALMADMTGGQSGLATSLALTGGNLSTFKTNVEEVGGASGDASGNVKDWNEVQKDFNTKLDDAKAGAESLGIKLGMALIPKIETVIDDTKKVVDWFAKHKAVAEGLGIAVGTILVVAIGAYTVSMVAAAIATLAATWPILAIIAAVALVGIGIAELATHWSTVWGWIKQVAGDVGSWFTKTVPAFFDAAWDKLKAGAGAVWDFLKTVFGWTPLGLIVNNWDAIIGFFSGLPGRIGGAASGLWDGIKNSFKAAINWVLQAWNGIHLSMPSIDTHIPGVGVVGGFDLRVPQLPLLAAGTDNWPGGPAIVGEQGAELVNLPRGSQVIPAGKTRDLQNGASGKGSGNVYIETFNAGGMSPQTVASALAFKLRTA